MRVAHNYGKVRIVHDGSPLDVAHDIRVEWFRDGVWKPYKLINSIADDYAYTNAQEAAGRAIKLLAAEAAANLPGV